MNDWAKVVSDAASGFAPSAEEQAAILDTVMEEGHHLAGRNLGVEDAALDWASSTDKQRRPGKRAVATTVLIAASFAAGGLALAQADGSGEDNVAQQYGLQSHPWSPGDEATVTADGLAVNGTVIQDKNCDTSQNPGKAMMIQEVDDHFYCIVADTKLDAWIIGQQLLGKTPSADQINEMRKEFAG